MSDDECFEDAFEQIPGEARASSQPPQPSKSVEKTKKRSIHKTKSVDGNITLKDAIKEAQISIDLFLNNHFDEAHEMMAPLSEKSIYHAVGNGVFSYLKAVMTFDHKHIEEASNILSASIHTIDGFRQKSSGFADSLGRLIRKVDYDSYTELEIHAELCYAKVLLLKAALTFCEDETLVSFIKAGFKVRSAYYSFRACHKILQERDWENYPIDHKVDFESGVNLGIGSFNLLISSLPARIMKLLEFIGFSGSRDEGFTALNKVYDEKSTMYHFLSTLILLGYHLIITTFLGEDECDINLCKTILQEKLTRYPNGVFYLFFKGRFHLVQCEFEKAIYWYEKSAESQCEWLQFHHICFWELFWTNTFRCEWIEAYKYANILFQESKWSKCFYGYQKAAMLCMIPESELNERQINERLEMMESLPSWKQRIAGKSLPMEKFAIRKSERFLDQGNRLTLPALELIYVWNGFKILGKCYKLIEPLYILVENKIREISNLKDNKYHLEDMSLLNLLKGICLKAMKSPLQAEECFKAVFQQKFSLFKADKYLVPYSMAEYGFILMESGNHEAATEVLENAKNNYKDYDLQSRLHFRIHAAQNIMKRKEHLNGDSTDVINHDV